MIPRTVLAVLAASALMLAACGSDDDSSSGSAPTADDLAGSAFESTAVTGQDLVADTTVILSFEADAIGARAGCNAMSGGYSISDGTLEVSTMASTMMACDDALMAQDTWLNEFLASGPEIALDGDTLTLTGAESTITLTAKAPAELEGTTWMLDGTLANQGISTIPVDAEGVATLTISDGTAQIATGCNSGSGSAEITDTTITFGPIALTRMACAADVMDLETMVITVLDGEVTYEIDGDRLLLRKDGADGEIGLDFTAQ